MKTNMTNDEAVDAILGKLREVAKDMGIEPTQDQLRDVTEQLEAIFTDD
jgi:hypothetical protein